MRHKTSGYFLLSALLVSLILGLCILLNLRCPQAVSDDALTQEQLTRGVTLTGWQQTGPGHWRFAFEAPADVPELVLCLSTRSLDAVPEGLEPTDQRGEAFWVRPVPGRTSEITVTSTTVPQMWLMLPDTLWHWRELRSSLQLMALVAFASMGAGILALFCFKPKHELGVFLLYLGVMFGWGLAVLLPAGQTGALLGFLMGLYFPFAVLTPLWLCCSLLHVALPRRGSRHFALSVLATLLFLMLGTSTQTVLRSVTLLAGMAAVLVVLARALAKKERPAWYLLAGYILTFGLRLTVVLPSFRFWFYRESFPFYMVRCARLYDIPFTLGCLVFVSRRYALQFDRTEQLAQELDLPVSVHDREAHAEMYELLRQYRPRGVLHCYSGSAEDAAWLTAQGMALGFGGAVTYKGAKRAAKVLAMVPHELAVLETDCPYMSPEPVRGTRNDSRNIAHVAAKIGEIWQMDAQSVLDLTAENAKRIFNQ